MKHSWLLAFVFSAILIVACGDDDSSVFPDSVGDLPSSSAESDDAPDSSGDNSSSSSVKSSSSGKSSSSSDAKSSSSVKSSSSGTSAGSSSSVNSSNASSSSSSKKTCKEEDEGKTRRDNGVRLICSNGFWVEIESSSSVSSSSYFDMTEQFNPDVEYGEFTDPRDGQKYRTISMYDDTFERTYVFFAENLNFGKMIAGGTAQGDSTKYCYDNDSWYCENGWGGLYTWSNAMDFPAICDSVAIADESCSQKFNYPTGYMQPQNYVQHQGICPEGWHVVNEGEWAYLEQISGSDVAYEMGSKVAGFGSKNKYGMSILPSGTFFVLADGTWRYEGIKKQTNFWMAQEYTKDGKQALITWIESMGMHRGVPASKSRQGYSVRCVKNY